MRHTPGSERHAASRDADGLVAPGEKAHLAVQDDPRLVVRSVDVKRRHVSRWTGDLDDRHPIARRLPGQLDLGEVGEEPARPRAPIGHLRHDPGAYPTADRERLLAQM